MDADRHASPPVRDGAWWPLVAAVCVLLAYDTPLLLMRGLALGGDGLLHYYPAEHALAAALARGSLPFWTPYVQAGFPLLAQGQPGAASPVNLLAFGLLPTPMAHNAILLAHQLLGLLGMFWWARTLALSRAAAAGTGLVFALATPLAGDSVVFVETVAWVPPLFAVAERVARRRRAVAAWPAAPLAAIQWLAGYPQIALYTALTSTFYLGGRLLVEPQPWSQRMRLLAAWCGTALIGALLGAPQLLPMYELTGYSIRAVGVPGSLGGQKSLFPAAVLTMFLPSWRRFLWHAGLGSGMYFGILPAVLALGAILRRQRAVWFYPLLAMCAVTLLLALGRYAPVFSLIHRAPVLAYFRDPSRFLLFTEFGLITCFGLAWDAMFRTQPSEAGGLVHRLLQATIALLLANMCAYPFLRRLRPQLIAFAEVFTRRHILSDPYHLQAWPYYQEKIGKLYDALIDAVTPLHADTLLPLGIAVAALLVLRCTRAGFRRHRWASILWGALILADLLFFPGGSRRMMPASLVTEGGTMVRFFKAQARPELCRLFSLVDAGMATFDRENLELLPANYNVIFDLSSAGLYAPLGFRSYYRLMDRLGDVDLGFGYRPVTPSALVHDRPLLDLLNVCYVLSRESLDGFVRIAAAGDVSLYRNDRALPRAFAVDEVQIVDSVDAALAWVKEHGERLGEVAVVEEPLPMPLHRGAAAKARVSIAEYQSTAVAIDVTTPEAVMLVLTDTDYPGWRAQLDGRGTRIYRTHGVFRSVLVPPGQHRIRFRYHPASFWYGLLAAALGAGLWITWGIFALRFHSRETSGAVNDGR